MRVRLTLAAGLLVAACGSSDAAGPDSATPATPAPTVPGVGDLPDSVPDTAAAETTTTEVPVEVDPILQEQAAEIERSIAEQVDGNRVIVIGDSIMASTATRFGREMCDSLTPRGWSVEVDAEPGRFIDFGIRVLDRRLPDEPDDDATTGSGDDADGEDWDAAIVHLGSNYRGDQEAYFGDLVEILTRLEPRPTLLFTVTEYRPAWSEVNDVIRQVGDAFENVTVVDWELAAREPGVLSGDGLHPTDAGEEVLVGLAGLVLGTYDDEAEGECLRSSFTDDSAIGQGGGSSSGSSTGGSFSTVTSTTGGSSSSGGSSSTTVAPSTSSPGDTTGGETTGGDTTGGDTTGGETTGGDTTGGDTTGGDTTGGDTTGGVTTGGDTTGADTTGGDTTGGVTTGGDTTGGDTTGGDTTGGDTTGGSTSGGSTTGGDTTGGSTTGGSTSGGSTTGGDTTGGSTTGGSTTGGSGSTTSGSTTGGSTTSGSTTGGSTTGGSTTGGSTTDGSTTGGSTSGGGADSTTGLDP